MMMMIDRRLVLTRVDCGIPEAGHLNQSLETNITDIIIDDAYDANDEDDD